MAQYDLPPKRFASDGCSGGLSAAWKKLFKKAPPFEQCCFYHDIEYHFGAGRAATHGENFRERLEVDNQFAVCLWRSCWQGKLLCAPMWLAVRLGGGKYFGRSYSWGFGWKDGA